MSEKKGKIDVSDMKAEQALNWIESIFKSAAMGSTEEIAYPEVLQKLKVIYKELSIKQKKQEKVIDYSLEKLNKKDVVVITKMLLE